MCLRSKLKLTLLWMMTDDIISALPAEVNAALGVIQLQLTAQCGASVKQYCSFEKLSKAPIFCVSNSALQAIWSASICVTLQGKAHGETEVISCLVRNYQGVGSDCQREVSRAVRMALWEYQPQLALTSKPLFCCHLYLHTESGKNRSVPACSP